jgi:hypothetical protein
LDAELYDRDYDLAVAADIVEHLSPEENEALYSLVSKRLNRNKGMLIVHTAPNGWNYEYCHPQEQQRAIQLGFWLPRIRRTWFERLMHINEQNPRVLKKQLKKTFPYVVLWFADSSAGGSFKKSTSIFAIASHQPIDEKALKSAFEMSKLSVGSQSIIEIKPDKVEFVVDKGQSFDCSVHVRNLTHTRLASLLPYPVNLSYHILNERGDVFIFDGIRTPFNPVLLPGDTGIYELRIKAPLITGTYYLQLALVQEFHRWYDQKRSQDTVVKIRVKD